MADVDQDLAVELVKAAGTHQRAEKVLRLLMQADITNRAAITGGWLEQLAGRIRDAGGEPRDPGVGDVVIVRGTIEVLLPSGGEALVRLHGVNPHDVAARSYVSFLAGQLEHDTAAPLFGAGVAGEAAGRG